MQCSKSFHLFSEVPLEIQNKIWETAQTYLERPHVHAITCIEDKDGTPILVSTSARINPLLNTSQRSRDVIISTKRLTYNFGTWISLEIDIILLDKSDQYDKTKYGPYVRLSGTTVCQELLENKTYSEMLPRIKNLALLVNLNHISCSNSYYDIDYLGIFLMQHSILALKPALINLRKLYL